MSRVELSRAIGLTKMTLTNLVSELLNENLIYEIDTENITEPSSGRKGTLLDISPNSPYVIGILIRRNVCEVVLSNLKGDIIKHFSRSYPNNLTDKILLDIIASMYQDIIKNNKREILGVGISAIGPIDHISGKIINPPDFFDIKEIDIVNFVEGLSGLKTFIINDTNAGALAEKTFGSGKDLQNFIYLHIINGISCGFVLDNKVYTGNLGQSGEIGHTSINFTGPQCSCGNKGCLDYYTKLENLRSRAKSLSYLYPESVLLDNEDFTLTDLIDCAHDNDHLAKIVLDEFCDFVAIAISNTLTLIDCNTIVVGYKSNKDGNFVENSILTKINQSSNFYRYKNVQVIPSAFRGEAPLVGSLAVTINNYLNGVL